MDNLEFPVEWIHILQKIHGRNVFSDTAIPLANLDMAQVEQIHAISQFLERARVTAS
jgi:hypothetical protein